MKALQRVGCYAASLGLLAVLALDTALAFDPQLSEQQIQQATQQGTTQVSRRHGYNVQDWVLWDDNDPFILRPGEGQVEAVVVGTPFEQLRYRAYLQAYQGTPLNKNEARKAAKNLANTVTFQVFAHAPGSGEKYRNFLSEFGQATLRLQGGATLQPTKVTTFGPAQDFYTIPGKSSPLRYLGYVAYRFDVGMLKNQQISRLQGTLSFTGSDGKDYSYKVNLANFK